MSSIHKTGNYFILFITLILIFNQSFLISAESANWPTNSWDESSPKKQDMNMDKLEEMMLYIEDEDLKIDSVVIVKNGYIVFERYLSSLGMNDIRELHSTAKSITSVLIGIAIEMGYLESINQKMLDFFPDRNISNFDSRKEDISIRHLLKMQSGILWDEWSYSYLLDDRNSWLGMSKSNDSIQYFLDKPMAAEPGTKWVYNSGGITLLSIILEIATGKSTIDFARDVLFNPLGISDYNWGRQSTQNYTYGSCCLMLTTRDLAKLGYLMLNNGTWDGVQIVPQDWVKESTKTTYNFYEHEGYGYQWWTLPKLNVYYSSGLFGQTMFVVPDHNIVVVFTSESNSKPLHNVQNQFLSSFILYDANPKLDPGFIVTIAFLIFPVLIILPYWKLQLQKLRTHREETK